MMTGPHSGGFQRFSSSGKAVKNYLRTRFKARVIVIDPFVIDPPR